MDNISTVTLSFPGQYLTLKLTDKFNTPTLDFIIFFFFIFLACFEVNMNATDSYIVSVGKCIGEWIVSLSIILWKQVTALVTPNGNL